MLFLVDAEESSLLLSLIRTLLLDICNIIYKLIITFYELFLAVGDATILNNEQLQPIFSRVGLILGIIMLFRLIFSFVQYMIDPDKITDKESGMGNLIKKVLVVVIALGLSNWVFTKAFEIQHIILEENTIGKVVLGMPSNDKLEMTDYGILFSYQVFSIFYHQSEGLTAEGLADAEEINCGPSFYDINGGTLINFVPNQKAGELVFTLGLVEPGKKWASVDAKSFESTLIKDVYVIGDAIDSAPVTEMPKSGTIANATAKVVAENLVRIFAGKEPRVPLVGNTCYSLVSEKEGIWIATLYEYDAAKNKIVTRNGANGIPKAASVENKINGHSWGNNILSDTFM